MGEAEDKICGFHSREWQFYSRWLLTKQVRGGMQGRDVTGNWPWNWFYKGVFIELLHETEIPASSFRGCLQWESKPEGMCLRWGQESRAWSEPRGTVLLPSAHLSSWTKLIFNLILKLIFVQTLPGLSEERRLEHCLVQFSALPALIQHQLHFYMLE